MVVKGDKRVGILVRVGFLPLLVHLFLELHLDFVSFLRSLHLGSEFCVHEDEQQPNVM